MPENEICRDINEIFDILDGETDDATKAAFFEHIKTCEKCKKAYTEACGLKNALRSEAEPSANFTENTMAKIRAAKQTPKVVRILRSPAFKSCAAVAACFVVAVFIARTDLIKKLAATENDMSNETVPYMNDVSFGDEINGKDGSRCLFDTADFNSDLDCDAADSVYDTFGTDDLEAMPESAYDDIIEIDMPQTDIEEEYELTAEPTIETPAAEPPAPEPSEYNPVTSEPGLFFIRLTSVDPAAQTAPSATKGDLRPSTAEAPAEAPEEVVEPVVDEPVFEPAPAPDPQPAPAPEPLPEVQPGLEEPDMVIESPAEAEYEVEYEEYEEPDVPMDIAPEAPIETPSLGMSYREWLANSFDFADIGTVNATLELIYDIITDEDLSRYTVLYINATERFADYWNYALAFNAEVVCHMDFVAYRGYGDNDILIYRYTFSGNEYTDVDVLFSEYAQSISAPDESYGEYLLVISIERDSAE